MKRCTLLSWKSAETIPYWSSLVVAMLFMVLGCPGYPLRERAVNTVTIVSAASFVQQAPVAPESIAAAFGSGLATRAEGAATNPLPFNIAGTTLRVNGELAQLLYVSPGQVNFLIPADTPPGLANVEVTSGDGTVSTGSVQIAAIAPGIFTANGAGSGPLAGQLLRIKPAGTQIYESLVRLDGTSYSLQPIEFGDEGDRLFLVLYLTGLRRAKPSDVRLVIGGVSMARPSCSMQARLTAIPASTRLTSNLAAVFRDAGE
jgi:uncharacterized protein (TIGR03437 family)